MGRSKEEISKKKGKGDNTSGSSVMIDFNEESADWDEWLDEKPINIKATPKSKNPLAKAARELNWENKPLTEKQERFCQLFVELNNGEQAAIKAGYSPASAGNIASTTLRLPNVAKRIKELRDRAATPHIATGSQVMQFFTDVMNGKIKDQFNLEPSLSDRTKAAIELAKRTIDLDQKLAGKPDATIEIKLDWDR